MYAQHFIFPATRVWLMKLDFKHACAHHSPYEIVLNQSLALTEEGSENEMKLTSHIFFISLSMLPLAG